MGGLVAFITLALLLVWPIEAMGYIIAGGQEAATAAQRVYEIFDTPPAIADTAGRRPAGARRRPRSPARAAGPGRPAAGLRRRHVQLSAGPGAGAARGQPGAGAGRDGGAGRRDRLGQDHAAAAGAPAGRRHRRRDPAGRHRRPGPAAARCCAAGWAARSRTRRCSRRASGRTSASAWPTPTRRTSRPRWTSPRPTSWPACRGAWTPGSASRAWPCPAASGSGSRWPGPSWPGRRCCCWTTRCPRWTCTPRPR